MVCTPNHMNAKLEPGDWIIGHSSKKTGNKLIYAMEVQEILDFDQYYHDSRFQYKKPKIGGKWWQKMGDNIYFKKLNGKWDWIKPSLHDDKRKEDTKHPIVFISKHFYYFGSKAIEEFPKKYPKLIKDRQGISYVENDKEITRFTNWLELTYKVGRGNNIPSQATRKPNCK